MFLVKNVVNAVNGVHTFDILWTVHHDIVAKEGPTRCIYFV